MELMHNAKPVSRMAVNLECRYCSNPNSTPMNFQLMLFRLHKLRHMLLTGLAWVAGVALAQGSPQIDLPRLSLTAGMHRIEAQVASTPDERQTGLMWRTQMPSQEGMLFAFEQPTIQCFWMKNTILPLSAAFVADDGSIVNLVDMAPQTTQSHCSVKPVRFVLEMNKGWFAKRGIKAGFKLGGAPFQP
jgi:uncharacterized membrane protein (UPF0127 family)